MLELVAAMIAAIGDTLVSIGQSINGNKSAKRE